MSQTSANVDANSTPPTYVIEVERLGDAEELNGWESGLLRMLTGFLKT